MEIAPKKLKDAQHWLDKRLLYWPVSGKTNIKTATKVKVMKSMVWAVFQYGVEGWTLKKSDRNRIEAFETWCWRKMLRLAFRGKNTIKMIQY